MKPANLVINNISSHLCLNGKEEDEMNIFVGNLSLDVTEDELRQEFVIFGKVTSVIFMNDLEIGSGRGRRCGYIEMPSVSEGETAIERLQGKIIRGHQIDIIKALPVTRNIVNEPDGYTQASGFSRKPRYWGGQRRRW
jgi:RNA recognition motif-containing protein